MISVVNRKLISAAPPSPDRRPTSSISSRPGGVKSCRLSWMGSGSRRLPPLPHDILTSALVESTGGEKQALGGSSVEWDAGPQLSGSRAMPVALY